MAKRGRKGYKIQGTESKRAFAEEFYDKHIRLVNNAYNKGIDNQVLQPERNVDIRNRFISEFSHTGPDFNSKTNAEHAARQMLAGWRGENQLLSQATWEARHDAKRQGVSLKGMNLYAQAHEIEKDWVTLDGDDAEARTYWEILTKDEEGNTVDSGKILLYYIQYYVSSDGQRRSPQERFSVVDRGFLNE